MKTLQEFLAGLFAPFGAMAPAAPPASSSTPPAIARGRLPAALVAEIQRGNSAGEVHALGRAFLLAGEEFGEVQIRIDAIELSDARQVGPGVVLVVGTLGEVFLDERARAQLFEQLERHMHIVGLHRAMAQQQGQGSGPAPIAGAPFADPRGNSLAGETNQGSTGPRRRLRGT